QADQIAHVPASLREASDLFTASEFARATFGDAVVDHYTHFFRNEQAAYAAAVTDWERKRYFERI
ncbi:MAG: glutamine synthetase, partial [Planctomycetaceae bacterium]|nr:glutamine synthetase [Planctomycetaceae bacterium]